MPEKKTKMQLRIEKERLRDKIRYREKKLGRKLTEQEIKEIKKVKSKTDRKLYQHIKYLERKFDKILTEEEIERVKAGVF